MKHALIASLVVSALLLSRAQAHDGNGAHNKADEEIAKITEELTHYGDDDTKAQAKLLVMRGALYLNGNHEYELALADFEKALALKPTYETARFGRGATRYRLGDWRGAVADLDPVCSAGTTIAAAWYFRGMLRHELGDDGDARSDLDRALGMITPETKRPPFLFVARAEVLAALGKDEEALADYTAAISRDPRNVDALLGRSLLERKLEHDAESAKDLDAVSELAPKDARLFAARARLQIQRGYILQSKAYAEASLAAYRLEAAASRSPNRRALLLLDAARLQAEAAGPWAGIDVLDEALGLAPERPDLLRLRVKLLELAKPAPKAELLETARKRLAEVEALRVPATVAPVSSR